MTRRMSFRVIEGGRRDLPSPAWMPDYTHAMDPARAMLVGALAGTALWCIGGVIVWAWWAGACR